MHNGFKKDDFIKKLERQTLIFGWAKIALVLIGISFMVYAFISK